MNEPMAMLLMKASRLITDYPPSAVAPLQLSLNCLATLLISFPSLLSKSINLPTHSGICSRINRFSHVPISFFLLFPIFQFPTIWLLLGCWSKEKRKSEHRSASIKIFKMELDPRCVKKPPAEEWHDILNWSHQDQDNICPVSPQVWFNWEASPRAARKNRTPLICKPTRISSIWALETERKLPNEMFKTKSTGWESSHWMSSRSLSLLVFFLRVASKFWVRYNRANSVR